MNNQNEFVAQFMRIDLITAAGDVTDGRSSHGGIGAGHVDNAELLLAKCGSGKPFLHLNTKSVASGIGRANPTMTQQYDAPKQRVDPSGKWCRWWARAGRRCRRRICALNANSKNSLNSAVANLDRFGDGLIETRVQSTEEWLMELIEASFDDRELLQFGAQFIVETIERSVDFVTLLPRSGDLSFGSTDILQSLPFRNSLLRGGVEPL